MRAAVKTKALSFFNSLLTNLRAFPSWATAAMHSSRSPFISSDRSLNYFSPVRNATIVRIFSSLAPCSASALTLVAIPMSSLSNFISSEAHSKAFPSLLARGSICSWINPWHSQSRA